MTEDARLMHWLSSHRDETATTADPAGHVDIDTLTRHATGRLSPAQAHAVTEHLLVCEDARCVSFVRAQASDVDAASDFLYPPNDERSSSPRTFQCKEMLWKMIEEVASITGAPVDEVINDAMLQSEAADEGRFWGWIVVRVDCTTTTRISRGFCAESGIPRQGSTVL